MLTTRHLLKPERRRALELLAQCRDGYTETMMFAHGFSIDMIVELINSGPRRRKPTGSWTVATEGKERGCASLRRAVGLSQNNLRLADGKGLSSAQTRLRFSRCGESIDWDYDVPAVSAASSVRNRTRLSNVRHYRRTSADKERRRLGQPIGSLLLNEWSESRGRSPPPGPQRK